MCGKFTAMYSWRGIHAFSQPIGTTASERATAAADAKSNDEVVTYRPVDLLPVIVWDNGKGERRIVPMRWGFPHRSSPNRPDPIHARSETIDEKAFFKDAFTGGQRGIVVMRTFNEGRELPPKKPGASRPPSNGRSILTMASRGASPSCGDASSREGRRRSTCRDGRGAGERSRASRARQSEGS
jgi:putative SOS response-associated peptidase YedK